MNTCSLSEAKSSLGRLADEALKGRPTVIARGGKLLILQAYDPPAPDAFDALIDEGIASEHLLLTDAFWDGVRVRGRELARKAVVKLAPGLALGRAMIWIISSPAFVLGKEWMPVIDSSILPDKL